MKGPTAGSLNSVYYGGYVYFEKLRIKNKGKKSKKRLDVEEAQPGGMPMEPAHSVICKIGQHPHEDKFGRIRVM